MSLAKLHEVVAVVGMRGKTQELLVNPHSVVACRPGSNGGSLITLSTGKEVEVTESPDRVSQLLLAALKG